MDTDYRLARLGCRILFNMFVARPEITGRLHLDQVDPPYIVACNHASLIDPALLVGYYPEPIRFLAKQSLADAPWIGFIERRLGNIHIRRDGSDVGPLREAVRMLQEDDRCLVIFVEGTRTDQDEDLKHAKQGTALLAARTGAPVIPVYLENTGRAAPPGTIVPTYYQVRMHIGPRVPLELSRKAPPQELEAATETIRQAILALRPPSTPA